jgi:hypothetical protein
MTLSFVMADISSHKKPQACFFIYKRFNFNRAKSCVDKLKTGETETMEICETENYE